MNIPIYAGRTEYLPPHKYHDSLGNCLLLMDPKIDSLNLSVRLKSFSQNGLMSDLQKLCCLNYKLDLLFGCMNSNVFFANPSNFGVIRRDYMQFHCHWKEHPQGCEAQARQHSVL